MTAFKVFINVMLYFIWTGTLLIYLERRFNWPVTISGITLLFLGWYSALFWVTPDSPIMQFQFLILIFSWYVIFKGSLVRRTVVISSIFLSMVTVEMTFALLFPTFSHAATNPVVMMDDTFAVARVIYLPANVLLLHLFIRLLDRSRARDLGKAWLPLLALLLGQVCFTTFVAQFYIHGGIESSFPVLCIMLFIFALSNLIFLYITWSISARSLLENRRELLDRQLAHQTAHYAALTEQYEAVRHMRHDIANHIHTIRILLKEGQREQAAAYARELEESYAESLGRDAGSGETK